MQNTELQNSRYRLLFVYLGVLLTGTLLCFGAYIYGQHKQFEQQALNQIGERLIDEKAPLLRAVQRKDRPAVFQILKNLNAHTVEFWDSDGKLWYQYGQTAENIHPKLAISLWSTNRSLGALVLSVDGDDILLNTQSKAFNTLMLVCSVLIFSFVAFLLSYSLIFFRPLSFIEKIIKQEVPDLEAELSGSQQTKQLNFIAKEILGLRHRIRTLSNIHQRQLDDQQHQLDETSKQLYDKQSKLVKQSLQVEKLEIHDALTGIYSRLHFENVLNNETGLALNNNDVYSIMVLQCNLKQINDRHGFKTGNNYLCHIADTLNKNKQKSDRAFRTGSGQFVIISKGSNKREIGLIAQYILSQLEETQGNISKIQGEVYIGMVSNPTNSLEKDPENFFNSALTALHYAQLHKRNCVHFSDIIENLKENSVSSITEAI